MTTWITDPPVFELSDLSGAWWALFAESLMSNINHWVDDAVDKAGKPVDKTDAIQVCKTIRDIAGNKKRISDNVLFGYRYGGRVLSLMVVRFPENKPYQAYIEWLVSHPGAEGAGVTLIEFLLNKLIKLGKHAIVGLISLDSAVDTYKAMGFEQDGQVMILNPEKSNKWTTDHRGKYHYSSARNPGQKYAQPDYTLIVDR